MMQDLRGASAVVTGAAQGLGYAVSLAYVRAGMHVTMIDVQADRLCAAAAMIMKETDAIGKCTALVADLADAGATRTAIQQTLKQDGTPRVLVHNAAILNVIPFAQVDFAEWSRVLNVSVQAAYLLSHAVWGPMAEAGGGSIIFVSSRSGIEGFEGESAYCTSKHALEGLMKTLAMEGKNPKINIAVNTVTPGMYMHTPMSERNYSDALKQKWIDPIQLAPAFLKLAAQDSTGITGQRISAWELSQGMAETAR